MIAATGIEFRIAVRTFVAACHVLCYRQFTSAGPAKHRLVVPLLRRPNLNRMACQSIMAIFAGVVDAAALHPDGNDVQGRVVVSTARLRIQSNAAHFMSDTRSHLSISIAVCSERDNAWLEVFRSRVFSDSSASRRRRMGLPLDLHPYKDYRTRRSASAMGASLMLARRRRINPSLSNSQSSFPYDRYHWPESSCHSYSKLTAMRLS
jgi:hypothetical protein